MKKKKVLALFVGIFLIFSLSFITSTLAEPIELKVSSWTPPQLPIAELTEKWARMVEERSGHTVKFTFYWAGTLAAYPDAYRVMQTGVADIGSYVFGSVSGIHPLNGFTSLPMIGWDDFYTAICNSIDCRLGQWSYFNKPLFTNLRLDHSLTAIAMSHGMGMRFDLLKQSGVFKVFYYLFTAFKAVKPGIRTCVLVHGGIRIKDIYYRQPLSE